MSRVLKKVIIVATAATAAMLCGVGVASAHEADGDSANAKCTSNDTTNQHNKGDQVLGGNMSVQDITTDVLGVQATRPSGICPSVLNNNHL
jgi:hypothetical protein